MSASFFALLPLYVFHPFPCLGISNVNVTWIHRDHCNPQIESVAGRVKNIFLSSPFISVHEVNRSFSICRNNHHTPCEAWEGILDKTVKESRKATQNIHEIVRKSTLNVPMLSTLCMFQDWICWIWLCLQAFNAEYYEYGGFQTLYLKLIASGVPTSVEMMRIPLDEWSLERLVQLPFRMIWWLLEDCWNSSLVVSVRPWYYKTLLGAFEETMIRFGFPVIQRIVPQKVCWPTYCS